MDYSLNSFGSPLSSNDSTVISSEWRDASFLRRLPYAAFSLLLFVAFIPLGIFIPTFTAINQYKTIKPGPIWQLRYQKVLKWYSENTIGTIEQSRGGELKDSSLVFVIPNNIWIDYNLKGEYSEKIQTVSLKRRFLTYYRFGKFKEVRQKGWNVVFTFSDPPRSGSCTIRHLSGL